MTPPDPASAPTNELGGVTSGSVGTGKGAGLLGGASSSLFTDFDPAPDWRWPKRVDTIDAMRRDSQVVALETAMFQPIRRWSWGVVANGASEAVTQFVADNLGLPVVGGPTDGPRPVRTRDRFRWSEHLRLMLRAPSYGSAWFEQVARVDDDGMIRLRKLAPRPLRTLTKVNVERDGGLVSIEQGGSGQAITIPVDRLVAYIWDADPGSWSGTSMLRGLYRHYWLKDKLYRVDAMKHERFGSPMPIFEAPPEATEAQIEALDLMAQAVRAGERAGGAVPSGTKSHLIGATGTGSDVVASISMHDQAMARAWASMVVQLAQGGEGGNRALGGTFADLLFNVQTGVAEWCRDTTQAHVVEDLVDWNYGPDELAPLLVFEADPDPALSVGDLVLAVDCGLVTVDPELEASFREKYRLPERVIETDTGGGVELFAYDATNGVVTIDEIRAAKVPPLPPREDGLGAMTVPEFLALVAGSTPADALEGDGVNLEPTSLPVAARAWRRTTAALGKLIGRHAAADPEPDPMLPDRNLRRQRTDVERVAATDFRALDEAWTDAVEQALEAWVDVQVAQRAAVLAAITEADGDLIALANLAAPVLGAEVIETALRAGIEQGIESGIAEAKAQGVTARAPGVDDALDDIDVRAEAMATTLARSYGEVAGRYAMLAVGQGGTPEDTAASVAAQLDKLTDTFIRDNVGAAVQGGQNAGRFAAFEAAGVDTPVGYYASEILDGNTCGPCGDVDGTEFATVAEAMAAYPMLGAYAACEGGPRCRGTVVALYGEASATVRVGDDG